MGSGDGDKGLGPGESALRGKVTGSQKYFFLSSRLSRSSPSTKPSFQATTSRQLTRVLAVPTASHHGQACMLWDMLTWVSPWEKGEGQVPPAAG